MKKTLIALFATASVFAGVSAASADTSTANLTVKATLSNGCGISFPDGNTVDFGKIYKIAEVKPQTHIFRIECTNKLKNPDGSTDTNSYTPNSVALNAGTSGDVANRLLYNTSYAGHADTLQFQVYQGSQASGKIWGDKDISDTTAPSYEIKSDWDGKDYPFTVALLNQTIDGKTIGTYSDVLVATVTYTATQTPAH